MELLKLLSASEIFAQIISFLILLFLLRIFAWRRILKLLDGRKERIASGFKNIEDGKAQVERLKAEYASEMSSIEDTARVKIQEAIQEGEKIVGQMRDNAQAEAQKIIENAKTSIKYEFAKAKESLKDEIIDIVINATEELIEEKITEREDKKIVKDFIERIDNI